MSAHEDVYLTRFEVGKQFLCLLGRASTREVIYSHGQVLQAVGEGVEVLIGEHGGRHQDCHLLAIDGRLESGTDSHLRLAESYVAADEAVHGAGALHVGLHVVGGFHLVGRVLIEEAGLQLVLHIAVGAELESLFLAPAAVELDEVARNVLDLGFRALFHPFPGACA